MLVVTSGADERFLVIKSSSFCSWVTYYGRGKQLVIFVKVESSTSCFPVTVDDNICVAVCKNLAFLAMSELQGSKNPILKVYRDDDDDKKNLWIQFSLSFLRFSPIKPLISHTRCSQYSLFIFSTRCKGDHDGAILRSHCYSILKNLHCFRKWSQCVFSITFKHFKRLKQILLPLQLHTLQCHHLQKDMFSPSPGNSDHKDHLSAAYSWNPQNIISVLSSLDSKYNFYSCLGWIKFLKQLLQCKKKKKITLHTNATQRCTLEVQFIAQPVCLLHLVLIKYHYSLVESG